MKFTGEDYRQAATEHITAAFALYEANPAYYVLAHYIAGLAFESILRAYRYRFEEEFDEKHDLRKLYKAARFDHIVPEKKREEIAAARGVVVSQWQNEQRYYSEAALRAFFKRKMLDRGIKGDFVKERTRLIVTAAFDLVSLGNRQWKIPYKP